MKKIRYIFLVLLQSIITSGFINHIIYAQTPQYSIGNYVKVIGTQNLNVRATAAGALIGSQVVGSQGKIIGGPTTATFEGKSYIWYNVDWQSGVDGWSVQEGFGLIIPSAPILISPGNGTSPGPVLSSSSQTFSWNPVSNADRCSLYIRDVNTSALYSYNITVPTTSSPQNLIAGHNYRWNMQAFNSTAASAISSTYYFQIANSLTTPLAPNNLLAIADATTINLTWSDNSSNEDGFKIERKIGASGTYTEIASVSNSTFYANAGVSTNQIYYYRVRAYNTAGNSGYSNEYYAKTLTAPNGLIASAVSSNQINLIWTDNANRETGFKIERRLGTGGSWSEIASPDSNTNTYMDASLSANTTYYYRIRAYATSTIISTPHYSGYSNEGSATTNPSLQTLFIDLVATPSSGSAPLTVTLSATVSGSATGTINYTFWWNCNDPSNSVSYVSSISGDPNNQTFGAKFDATNENPKTVAHTYSSVGNYVAKIIAERGSAIPVEMRVMINSGTLSFQLPVNDPIVTQPYGCRDCLSGLGLSERYLSGINVHTGVDVKPSTAGSLDYTKPVKATADGWIEKIINYGSSRGVGNTIIIRHSNNKYSLYGHLDSFQSGISIGQFVAQGTQIGIMGNSSSVARDNSFNTHVHFEIKDYGVLGDVSDSPGVGYVGYTPGQPDFYHYLDPRMFFEGLSVETITPTVLVNPPPGKLNVRSSPGTTYSGSTPTSVIANLGDGHKAVARKKAIVTGVDWYFVDLPSRNSPLEGSLYPNNGPNGGWVSGGFVTLEPSTAPIKIVNLEYNVRSTAGTADSVIAKVYSGQYFVTAGLPMSGIGCSGQWYPVFVSGNSSVTDTTGWICGDGTTSVGQNDEIFPTSYSLSQNYPNPFNPSTTIKYALPEASHVNLCVFSVLGQRVSLLVDGKQEAGYYEVNFDASGLTSGVYFYRLQAGHYIETKKLILLK